MKKILLLTLLIVLIIFYFSLNRKELIHNEKIIVDNNNLPVDSNQLYFPKKSFKDYFQPWADTMKNKWYSNVLYEMNEPILYNGKEKIEIYRFIWLRSFKNSIVVRVENHNDKYNLFWKVYCDSRKCEEKKLIVDKSRSISKKEWDKLKWHLRKTFFWRMWTVIPSITSKSDGSEWVLEGANINYYHVVDRWCPENINYRNCCLYLTSLTDIEDLSENR